MLWLFICPLAFCIFGMFALFFLWAILATRRPPKGKLLQIASQHEGFQVNDYSEDGYYANNKESELVEVFGAINREKYPARYSALILEVRRRVANNS